MPDSAWNTVRSCCLVIAFAISCFASQNLGAAPFVLRPNVEVSHTSPECSFMGPTQDQSENAIQERAELIREAVVKARDYLLGRDERMLGEIALQVLALSKIEKEYPSLVDLREPRFVAKLQQIREAALPTFKPSRRGGADNYEAGVAAMALATVRPGEHLKELESVVGYILSKQNQETGEWSYDGNSRGDVSMVQYSILGLWEANRAPGISVPAKVWDSAAQWLLSVQNSDGGWSYHPAQPPTSADHSYHTMTTAALGTLAICQAELRLTRPDVLHSVIRRASERPALDLGFTPRTTHDELSDALSRGSDWLSTNFTIDHPTGHPDSSGAGRLTAYYLYALERYGTLSRSSQIAGVDWFAQGSKRLLELQDPEGSWRLAYAGSPDTAFSTLFLVRATKNTIRDGDLIPGGVLDGRPRLAELLRPGWGKKSRMEEFLKTITSSSSRFEWKEVTVDVIRDHNLHPAVVQLLASEKVEDRALAIEMLTDSRSWVGKTKAYSEVPFLINALFDSDSRVVDAALRELRRASRNFDGFGFQNSPTRKTLENEIREWTKWYHTVRPDARDDNDIFVIANPMSMKPVPGSI